jgi:predicted ATPase
MLVGPNASGKSSILQGLNLLCQIFPGPHHLNHDDEIAKEASRGSTDSVELAAQTGGQWYRYRSRVRSRPHPPLGPPGGMHRPAWTGEGCGVAPALDTEEWKPWQFKGHESAPLPLSILLRLETSNLIQANPASPDPAVMAPTGAGLHSALANMALNDPDSWQQLQANLRRIIPTIRRLRHTRAGMQQQNALLFDTVGGDSLEAFQVSEGTLLVLGLLAALHAPERPNLMLLDDLEKGLHPRAQKELVTLLRGFLEANPELQIAATTHSPYLLDCMEPKEVRLTHLNDEGATICASLTQHPKFRKWKDEFDSGELWSMFGEKWMIEAEAVTLAPLIGHVREG